MKKLFAVFMIITLILGGLQFNIYALDSEGTVVILSCENEGYDTLTLDDIDSTIYNWNKNKSFIMDNAITDDKVSDCIIEADIMFPKGSRSYLSVLIYGSASSSAELFRVTYDGGVSIIKSGATALGITEVSQTTALYDKSDESNDDFKTICNRWNKLRATFSSTGNRVTLHFNDKKVSYEIFDTDQQSFASDGAFRFCFYTITLAEQSKLYAKNVKSYNVYDKSGGAVDKRRISERSGEYSYEYLDTSGDFKYALHGNSGEIGYASITGFDPNKCTKEIEAPVSREYTLPIFAEGYKVSSVSADAFKDLSALHRLTLPSNITCIKSGAFNKCNVDTVIIDGDIHLQKGALYGAGVSELVFKGNVDFAENPFMLDSSSDFVTQTIYCRKSDMEKFSLAFSDSGITGVSINDVDEYSDIKSYDFAKNYANEITLPVTGENVTHIQSGSSKSKVLDLIKPSADSKKIRAAIIEFEVMFPQNTTNYAMLQLRSSNTIIALQINRNGLVLRGDGTNLSHLGYEGNLSNAENPIYNSNISDSYRTMYDTWSKIRIVFSADDKFMKIYFKDDGVKEYFFTAVGKDSDGDGVNDYINNVTNLRIDVKNTGSSTEDLGMYFKNAKSYWVFEDASEESISTITNESGNYAYTYDNGSAFFEYTTEYNINTRFAAATITGFKDADSKTEGYQLPEGSEFTIPYYVDGYPVKSIGAYAFSKNDSNANVSSDDKTADGRYINIHKINMPNSVITISKYAFYGMHGVKEINLPSELTTIGDYSFANNFSVNKITFNDKLTTIGDGAFNFLGNLSTENAQFKGPILKNSSTHKISRIDIPASVTTLNQKSLENVRVKTLVIHGSSVKYGWGVFKRTPVDELVIIGDMTCDEGVNVFITNGDTGTNCYRLNNLYCSDSVYEKISSMKKNNVAQNAYVNYTYSPAWIDADNNKAYLMSGTAEAFTALYNEDESFAGATASVTLDATERAVSADISADSEAYCTKAFIWNALEGCIPLCKTKELQKVASSPDEQY